MTPRVRSRGVFFQSVTAFYQKLLFLFACRKSSTTCKSNDARLVLFSLHPGIFLNSATTSQLQAMVRIAALFALFPKIKFKAAKFFHAHARFELNAKKKAVHIGKILDGIGVTRIHFVRHCEKSFTSKAVVLGRNNGSARL